MARNVFISFLGNSPYKKASYQLKEQTIPDVIFVQEALLKLFFSDPTPKDHIFIFLTDEAKQKNWGDNGHIDGDPKKPIPLEGLKTKLRKAGYDQYTSAIDIPSGGSTIEIWQIFEKVYEQLKGGDRIYLDITHSFRSIPMLSMTLLNYARALKNVELQGIYYGAWEARDANNIAPIFDLTPLDEIQRWSSAVNQFIKYGQVEELREVMKETYTPNLERSNGKDSEAKRLKALQKKTHELAGLFSTNRGRVIGKTQFFQEYMNLLKEKTTDEEDWDHFMDPLKEKMIEKVKPFVEEHAEANWLLGVRWCVDHNLIQQGITQLDEGVITEVMRQMEEEKLNPFNLEDRKFVRQSFFYYSRFISKKKDVPNNSWKNPNRKKKEKTRRVFNNGFLQAIAHKQQHFAQVRNEINHAGYADKKSYAYYKNELLDFYTIVNNAMNVS